MNHLSISSTVVDSWYWWEFEEYIKRLNTKIDAENKANNESSSQQKVPDISNKIPNVNSMMKNIGKYK